MPTGAQHAGNTVTLDATAGSTVEELKHRLAKITGLMASRVRLSKYAVRRHQERQYMTETSRTWLRNECTVAHYNLKSQTILEMHLKQRGMGIGHAVREQVVLIGPLAEGKSKCASTGKKPKKRHRSDTLQHGPKKEARSKVYNMLQWPDWEEKFDATGKIFYVDHTNRQTHWEHPAVLQQAYSRLVRQKQLPLVQPPPSPLTPLLAFPAPAQNMRNPVWVLPSVPGVARSTSLRTRCGQIV